MMVYGGIAAIKQVERQPGSAKRIALQSGEDYIARKAKGKPEFPFLMSYL